MRLVVLFLIAVLLASAAAAQATGTLPDQPEGKPRAPLPDGLVACNLAAINADTDPNGLNVRARPGTKARILGILPPDAIFEVLASKDGWLLIENAVTEDEYLEDGPDAPGKRPSTGAIYRGRGWVSGAKVTADPIDGVYQAPRPDAPRLAVVVQDNVKVNRFLACAGDWAQLDMTRAYNLPSGDPGGRVVGWVRGLCANPVTTCN